jgi:hypothetical protein
MRRFFVRVFAPNRRALVGLRGYGLDLFRATAVAAQAAIRAQAVAGGEEGAFAGSPTAEDGTPADSLDSLTGAPWVDGLLTLEEIERLVVDGYRVLVNEDADKRARARTETIGFETWLKGMEER